MAHPVAHEGNPRTNSITISGGDMLSTASLEVVLPGPSQSTPVFALPGPQTFIMPSNSIKYVLPADSQGNITFVFGNGRARVPLAVNPNNAATPTTIDPANGFTEYSRSSSVDVYGLIKRPSTSEVLDERVLPNGFKVEDVRFADFLAQYYNGSSDPVVTGLHPTGIVACFGRLLGQTGTPISGPAIAVDPNSTPTDFTGYALLANAVNSRLELVFYNHQSLGGTIPTPLATVSTFPVATQYLQFEYTTQDIFGVVPAALAANVYNSDGTTASATTWFNGIDFTFPATENHFRDGNDYAAWVNVASGINGSANGNDYWEWDTVATGMGFGSSGHL